MTERNKESLELFAKMGALIVWLLLVIITCCGVWNFDKEEGFVRTCALLLMLVNLGAIGYLFVKWRKEYNAAIKAIQDKERQELKDQAK